MMERRWRLLTLIMIAVLVLAACKKAESDPTPTPDQLSIEAASTLFAQSSREATATPASLTSEDVEIELNRTIAHMEDAVTAGDLDAYLSYVSEADPAFYRDHLHWAQDWVDHPVEYFQIDLYNITPRNESEAEARMTIRWRVKELTGNGSAGGATISALFYQGEDRWLFGGPSWETVELEGIRFYYFATEIMDNTPQANVVIGYLPSIYTGVTVEFDFVPEDIAHIQMFESPITLRNWTRLSQPDITRWNQPGESIKIPLTENNTAPYEPDMGREFTRFVLYEMSDGTLGNFPWWLSEGIVEYGGQHFSTLSQRNRVLRGIAALSLAPENAEEQLFAWDELVEEPVGILSELQVVAAQQAYTLVHYVTETYGEEQRNAWIRAIATDQTLESATEDHLGTSFEALDAAWRAWLPSQM